MADSATIIQFRQREAMARLAPLAARVQRLINDVWKPRPMRRSMARAVGMPWAEPQTDDMAQMLDDLRRFNAVPKAMTPWFKYGGGGSVHALSHVPAHHLVPLYQFLDLRGLAGVGR